MIAIKEIEDGLIFSVYVQPRSSKIAIVGSHQNALKIKLTAPPVGGAANKQCIQVMAKSLGLPKSAVTISSGQTSRLKQIIIQPPKSRFSSETLSTLKDKLTEMAQ